MAQEPHSSSEERVPILNLKGIVEGTDPAYKIRIIFQQIINMALQIPQGERLKRRVRAFIDFINHMIEAKELPWFGLRLEDFFKNLPYVGGFAEHDGRLISMPLPQDILSPINRALLGVRVHIGSRSQVLPLVLIEGVSYENLKHLLEAHSTVEANNAAQQIVDNFVLRLTQTLRLLKGPILSLDDVEARRGADFDEPELQSLLTMFGYENAEEMYDDLKDIAIEVTRHDDQDDEEADNGTAASFAQAGLAAAKLAHRFLLHVDREGALAEDTMNSEEMSKLIGYTVGSGGLTFVTLYMIYLIWRALALNTNNSYRFPRDIFSIRFEFESGDKNDLSTTKTVPFITNLLPSMVENQSIPEARTMIILIMRDYFGRVHWAIQESFNERKQYWYHGSGSDYNAEYFKKLTVLLRGINIIRRQTYEPEDRRVRQRRMPSICTKHIGTKKTNLFTLQADVTRNVLFPIR